MATATGQRSPVRLTLAPPPPTYASLRPTQCLRPSMQREPTEPTRNTRRQPERDSRKTRPRRSPLSGGQVKSVNADSSDAACRTSRQSIAGFQRGAAAALGGPAAPDLVPAPLFGQRHQLTTPCRSLNVPVGPSEPMVAMATTASVPSVTVWGPEFPFSSVAV